ncbi:MAG: hypothetical protein HGA53_00940 [Anaerolineaceae bacterium]|nr:hypothetical protein [Anaerolineaceae bacterium]NTV35496.1 hypothetical protein [Anaerolineaceae bacterium]
MDDNTYPLPYTDSYWVIPGKFLAGEYPGARDEEQARRKLRALVKCRIQLFIDLTQENELVHYLPWLQEEAADYGRTVEYLRIPIKDFGTPSKELMVKILDTIDQSILENKPLYVHCWGGIGRTGTVVGCYLVRHGLKGALAIERIKQLREGVSDWWRSSPETPEQTNIVLKWKIGT